jgi:5'-3' exonuclease
MSLESLRAKFFEISQDLDANKSEGSKVMLVDGMNTYLRAFAATPTMSENGDHVGGITGFLMSVGATVRTFKPSRLVIVFDGPGGSQKRRKLFPDYKAKRRSMTQLNRTYDFKSVESEKDAIKWQLKALVTLLGHLPVTVISQEHVEADDVIAYLAETIKERGGQSIIVSTDKDFLQLVDDNTTVYNPVKRKSYKADGVVEDYGFHPHNFLLYRMVTGDNSDCIPGVKGIGEKTLIKYFPEFAQDDPKDLNYVISKAAQIAEEKKKKVPVVIKTLLESRETLERNLALMRLDDAAMSDGTRMEVLKKFDKPTGGLAKVDFLRTLVALNITGMVQNVDMWLISTFGPLMRFKVGK